MVRKYYKRKSSGDYNIGNTVVTKPSHNGADIMVDPFITEIINSIKEALDMSDAHLFDLFDLFDNGTKAAWEIINAELPQGSCKQYRYLSEKSQMEILGTFALNYCVYEREQSSGNKENTDNDRISMGSAQNEITADVLKCASEKECIIVDPKNEKLLKQPSMEVTNAQGT